MPKLSDQEIEIIEKTLTKTWSVNRMESGRYLKMIRDNSYTWLTELVSEVKELRAKAADPTPVQPDSDIDPHNLPESTTIKLVMTRSEYERRYGMGGNQK
ncbi:hypothetical protein H70357_24610 [Paenibacillus sp. FSL H7-0357]|uniref:hypothetical protein n=1 Tax=Paenibacillus sp. FSL H7-0357 TaxID=1536774 RepID=UPI0004F90B7A|nr:hypothetical protein [Paenibacillus sp. FSL H7-0357]AIQ19541.1 hypothetical protein H70357_24610 [Paenibacillus sp. FSL H7-0357]